MLGRPLQVAIYEAAAREFPKPRDFAYCHTVPESGTWLIGVAPKLSEQSLERIQALLMHEIAHAVLLDEGAADHTERDADEMAEALFGTQLSYDREDVQTTGHGTHPRPEHLPR